MLRIDYNPCSKKYDEWLSHFTQEQQEKINEISNGINNAPKLIKLKRNRQPVEVNIGDVFLVSNKEGIHFYGKVIQRVNTQHPKYRWMEESYVAFIFNCVTEEKKMDNYLPNYDNCVSGPKLFLLDFWKKGYLEIIGNIPLTKEEKKLDIGFFDGESRYGKYSGIFRDAQGKELSHFPKYYNWLAGITIDGISMSLSTAYITNPSLLEE